MDAVYSSLQNIIIVKKQFIPVGCGNFDDDECITNKISGNQNLQSCATLLSGQTSDNANAQVICGLSCIEDLRGLYDTCGFSRNPVEAREFPL